MALNWEKLNKLRRDYPKPKFALAEIGRQLKKRHNDPYLLSWKADIWLQMGIAAPQVLEDILIPLCTRQPPTTDPSLLSYIYFVILEATRIANIPNSSNLSSAGDAALKAWHSAAKSLHSRKARLDLWSKLFVTAMEEDCWEDVRWSVTQALQENPQYKKRAAFALILANQLAYEKKCASSEAISPAVEIQKRVAHQKMLQAFQNTTKSPNDPVRIQDSRDVRFMAQIFERQKLGLELTQLWSDAPDAIRNIMDANFIETQRLMFRSLKAEGQWRILYARMFGAVKAAIDGNAKSELRTLARNWELWGSMIEALSRLFPEAKAKAIANDELRSRIEGMGFNGRDEDLTKMAVVSYADRRELLALCEDFWVHFHHTNACFRDLHPFVARLSRQEQEKFLWTITPSPKGYISYPENVSTASLRTWLDTEINVARFDYMLNISRARMDETHNSTNLPELFVCNAIRLYKIAAQVQEDPSFRFRPGWLAIMAMLKLQELYNAYPEFRREKGPLSEKGDRVQALVQAGFLALHMTADEAGKQDRGLILLSTRLHTVLGLGTIAFDQYRHAQIKEILNDTLSYFLLSRISQSHPFDSVGETPAYPDAELAKVISTIQRMENRVGDFIYSDLENFQYDQTFELLQFKQKLRSSVTKHLCLIERRRIARLKGEIVDSSLDFDLGNFRNISDNRDFSVLQNYEFESEQLNWQTWLHNYPNIEWIVDFLQTQERACMLAFQELRSERFHEQFREEVTEWKKSNLVDNFAQVESWFLADWSNVLALGDCLRDTKRITESPKHMADVEARFDNILHSLNCAELQFQHEMTISKTAPSNNTPGTHVLENLMPTEGYLQYFFGQLELLLVYAKLIDQVRNFHKLSKFPPSRVKKEKVWVDKVATAIQNCYTAVRNAAQSYIDALRERGLESVLKHAKAGVVGEALVGLMGEEEMRGFAREYVESAVDALEGVLKVRIK
ncbi:uncharacterized protein BDR25DRAFT_111755 [Lindgomyces ingoldianus]|uniref:Uncharacterized protein n=1 Tax=Lindgomyces ingoldianus TaxID=673940 RepID=A0ACB6R6D6_9PLEO|nr:uncharacterized protein BDR25DRAFT_111755 [Lindgomyces ingoldianus]KAF2474751.1 hypothetical protein BDR25DRAFT_111755 [Lindgomyces ingoldianus]